MEVPHRDDSGTVSAAKKNFAQNGGSGGSTSNIVARSQLMFSDAPQTVKSKLSISRPQTHRLPTRVIWTITLAVPVLVACINYLIVIGEHLVKDNKFVFMQDAFNDGGVFVGACVLAGSSAVIAGVATWVTSYFGPLCVGSGVPEAKGYLNGNNIPKLFTLMNLAVRIIGITLACAAGFPIGREGPMVCIGGTVGVLIVHHVAKPSVRRWVDVHTQGGDESEINPALIVDEERFAHAKRIGCALGGAAGIASAFNAPIGGILYMFEEVTVTSWPPELTFRAFVCTVLSALLSRGMLNLTHDDVHHLVIFDESKSMDQVSWGWQDIPFFVVLSLFCGFFSAFMTRAFLAVWAARDRFKKNRFLKDYKRLIKASEVVVFAAVCSFAFALSPSLLECMAAPGADVNATGSHTTGLRYVRHDCEEGEHREVATLLLTGAEEAVKHLFSRHHNSDIRLAPLIVATSVYSVLACGMPGLPVPMGCFVPCLLIGAMLGRFMGEAAPQIPGSSMSLAHPGVYALVGSAAMLSGFTHMTIAIVVLLVEAAADLSLVGPIMLGIFIASLASKKVNHHAYDEVLILMKGVPFLDAEVPHEMDNEGSTASDLCDEYPDEACLSPEATTSAIIAALDWGNQRFMDFPIVERGRCVGLTTRTRLEATVQALRRGSTRNSLYSSDGSHNVSNHTNGLGGNMGPQGTLRHLHEEDKTLGITRFVSGMVSMSTINSQDPESQTCALVPVYRIMDKSPYTILEDMPAPRFYPLFIKAGVNAAAVVSRAGEFIGVLTRGNLISQTREAHLPIPMRKESQRSGPEGSGSPKRQISNFSDAQSVTSSMSQTMTGLKSSLEDRESLINELRAEIVALKAQTVDQMSDVKIMML